MAVQGSGLGKGPDDGAFTEQTKFDARGGSAKRAQTSFPDKWGMKDQTKLSGIAPSESIGPNNASGALTGAPDASSPNPLDPEPRVKNLKKQSQVLQPSWQMKGAAPDMSPSQKTGKDVHGMPPGTPLGSSPTAGKVLDEAVLSGSSKLPSGESYNSAGPVRQPGA